MIAYLIILISLIIVSAYSLIGNSEENNILNPYSVSNNVAYYSSWRPSAVIHNNILISEGSWFKYGDYNLTNLVSSLNEFGVKMSVHLDKHSFGYYILGFNVGQLSIGIIDSSDSGMGIIYGNQEVGYSIKYLFLKDSTDFNLFFYLFSNSTLLVQITQNIDSVSTTLTYYTNMGNYSYLRHGSPMKYFLFYNKETSDVSKIIISNFFIEEKQEKSRYNPLLFFLFAYSVFVFALAVIFRVYNTTPLRYILLLLIISISLPLFDLSKYFMEFTYCVLLVGGFSLLNYLSDDFYIGNKQPNMLIISIFFIFLAILMIGISSGEGIYHVYRFERVVDLPKYYSLYEMGDELWWLPLLITGILLIQNMWAKYVGIALSGVFGTIISYYTLQNLPISISVGIFSIFAMVILESESLYISKFWRLVLYYVGIGEMIAFLTFEIFRIFI